MRTIVMLGLLYIGDCILKAFTGNYSIGYSDRTITLFGIVFVLAIIMDLADFISDKFKQ